MKNSITLISSIILVIGCITLGISLLIAAIAPNIFLVYLTANPSSFSHDILYPNMTSVYILSAVEIVVGIGGILSYGSKKPN